MTNTRKSKLVLCFHSKLHFKRHLINSMKHSLVKWSLLWRIPNSSIAEDVINVGHKWGLQTLSPLALLFVFRVRSFFLMAPPLVKWQKRDGGVLG